MELLIKPENENIEIESYINFLLPFIDDSINKDLLISIEPVNSFIEKQATNIYNKVSNTNQDFLKLEEYFVSSLTQDQNDDIAEMINIVIKSLVDGLDTEEDIKKVNKS